MFLPRDVFQWLELRKAEYISKVIFYQGYILGDYASKENDKGQSKKQQDNKRISLA